MGLQFSSLQTENGKTYYIRFSGLIYVTGKEASPETKYDHPSDGVWAKDGTWQYFNDSYHLHLNGQKVPYQDRNPNHVYWFTHQGNGSPFSFNFYDNSSNNYDDNHGSLNVKNL